MNARFTKQMALEAAKELEAKLDELRDEEEGWDGLCTSASIVLRFIEEAPAN
ncbi:MAG: hypothetical protein JST59_16190 [Actinobacteria bacterium]|nr:hypothetical protein [Actinomycetota bacterium]